MHFLSTGVLSTLGACMIIAGFMMRFRAVGVAVISYLGQLHFGLIGDWDLLSDLPTFSRGISAAFAELREAAKQSRMAPVE